MSNSHHSVWVEPTLLLLKLDKCMLLLVIIAMLAFFVPGALCVVERSSTMMATLDATSTFMLPITTVVVLPGFLRSLWEDSLSVPDDWAANEDSL